VVEEAMIRVSISELKAKLSEYLEAVRVGEEVIVTDRGRPVARIAPVTGSEKTEHRMRMLIRTGQARPPQRAGGVDLRRIRALRPRVPSAGLVDAVLEERREGR
jgi:prevent-host-death family protein